MKPKTIKQTTIKQALGYLLLLLTTAVAAQHVTPAVQARLPEYYPDHFPQTGTLQEVNIEKGTLLINATQYRYDTNVKVHSLHTAHSSLRALKPGMGVGYALGAGKNAALIAEIWVIPAEAVILR